MTNVTVYVLVNVFVIPQIAGNDLGGGRDYSGDASNNMNICNISPARELGWLSKILHKYTEI